MVRINSTKAFTLAELAIVITIISLLSLVTTIWNKFMAQSRTQAVIAEAHNYTNAVDVFHMKYDALPGDMNNATTVLSGAAGNGNGDGGIDAYNELYLAWNHLSLAQIVPGIYTGLQATGPIFATNVPASRYPNMCWTMEKCTTASSYCSNIPANVLTVGGPYSTWGCYDGFMSKKDAKYIDMKMDDGLPSTGNVRSRADSTGTVSTNTHCFATIGGIVQYNISVSPNSGCALVFKLNY
jgi:prepilin-type N-terminal cleavage/methylation domain-containing protein